MRKKKLVIGSRVKGRPKEMVREKDNLPSVDISVDACAEACEPTPWKINPGLTKRVAYEAYMAYHASKEQLLELGIPESTLNTWLYQPSAETLSWHMQREQFYERKLNSFMKTRSKELEKVGTLMLSIANRSLVEMENEGVALNASQLDKLFSSFTKVMKELRLEEGKPTEIKESFHFTQKGLEQLLQELQEKDPLMDYSAKGKHN